jgi:hypothetical protein
MCWLLVGVVCSLYEAIINFKEWGVEDITYGMTFSVLFFTITVTNGARPSSILVQKLCLEGNCRNERVEGLKMFSLQLQVMEIEYTACGLFSLNLRLFGTVVSVIASYIVIMVQIK